MAQGFWGLASAIAAALLILTGELASWPLPVELPFGDA
jgi:hypothetical protein